VSGRTGRRARVVNVPVALRDTARVLGDAPVLAIEEGVALGLRQVTQGGEEVGIQQDAPDVQSNVLGKPDGKEGTKQAAVGPVGLADAEKVGAGQRDDYEGLPGNAHTEVMCGWWREDSEQGDSRGSAMLGSRSWDSQHL
jgi:hypothetical protein